MGYRSTGASKGVVKKSRKGTRDGGTMEDKEEVYLARFSNTVSHIF